MFKVRKFKRIYYVLLLLVFMLTVFTNYQSLQMATISCSSMGGVCEQIELYLDYTYFAYGSIILFVLMVLYWYVFHSKKELNKDGNAQKNSTNEAHYKIDFAQESSRNYINPFVKDEE